MKKEQVVIIGSGCAGLSAAIYTARAQLNPYVLEGELPGGLLTQTTEVENFPGFPEGIRGLELMKRMRTQAEKFGARFEAASLKGFQKDGDRYVLQLSNNTNISCQTLIIATGSHHNLLGLPQEQELLGGKGLSVCATCDGFFYRKEDVCVIGGGDSACEEALYLSKLCRKVYLIHRRDQLRASKIMAERVQNTPNIELVWQSVPLRFEQDEQGFVKGLSVTHVLQGGLRTIDCKGIFLAIGWKPNTQIFEGMIQLDAAGYIQTQAKSLETSLPGVFAAGDCVDAKYRQAAVAAGMGIQAALELESWLLTHSL